MKNKTSKFATASILLCLVAPFCFIGSFMLGSGVLIICSFFLPIYAVILGIGALHSIGKSKGELVGRGRAWVGAVGGCLLIAFYLKPPISGILTIANAKKIGNNGTNIVLSIISANSEREARGLTNVWPGISSDFSGTRKDYTKVPDSETYFSDLVDSGTVEKLSWHVFAGAGISPAKNRESFKQGNHNAWNVVAGLDDNTPDYTPFLFTRNLNITVDDLRDNTVNLQSKLDRKIKPFVKDRVVFIQKGGAMQQLPRVFLRNPALFSAAAFDDGKNKNATILKAKGMPE